MVIAPCGIRIERLVERQAKAAADHKRHRAGKVDAKKMPAEVAAQYDRFDAAVLVALQILLRIEQADPVVIERCSKPAAAAAHTSPTAPQSRGQGAS